MIKKAIKMVFNFIILDKEKDDDDYDHQDGMKIPIPNFGKIPRLNRLPNLGLNMNMKKI